MRQHTTLGKIGEDFLADFLAKKSWTILERNFRRKGSEIDIIATKEKTLIFVEVKFRKIFSQVFDADVLEKIFNISKQRAIQRGVQAYIQENKELCFQKILRIDLALITTEKTKGSKQIYAYYPNVIYPKDAY